MTTSGRGGRVADMEVFLCVVEAGSFSAAGRSLGLTPSAVSKLVSRIEKRLDVRLFCRSSHGLALTPEGTAYHQHSRRLVSDLDEVERTLTSRDAWREKLRVTASRCFAEHQLVPALPELLARHPTLEIALASSENTSEVLEGRADVDVHVGTVALADALHARKLATSRAYVVASPEYLHARGTPLTPDALSGHDCLRRATHAADDWMFVDDDRTTRLAVTGSVQTDSREALHDLARRGVGIAWLPDFMVASDVRRGRLVRLLERFVGGCEEPVSALFVTRPDPSSRVRAFVDFCLERFGRAPAW